MRLPDGGPTVRIFGKIKRFADTVGVAQEDLYISITHSELSAVAVCIVRGSRSPVELYTAEEMFRADAGAQDLGIPAAYSWNGRGTAMARVALEITPGAALIVRSGAVTTAATASSSPASCTGLGRRGSGPGDEGRVRGGPSARTSRYCVTST